MKNNLVVKTKEGQNIELLGDVNALTVKGFEVLNNWYKVSEIEANGKIEIEHFGNYATYNGYEYLIIEGYENTISEATEQAKALIEDCGLNETLILEADLKGWIKEEYFKEVLTEMNENTAYNEDLRYIAWDDELAQIETGELDEDDFREEYFNRLQDSIGNDWIGEYKNIFGQDDFYNVALEKQLVDIEALAKWCVEMDGAGHYLASYDGEELEHNNIFLYRVN